MKELPATLISRAAGLQDPLHGRLVGGFRSLLSPKRLPPALALILISSVPMAFLVLRERSLAPAGGGRPPA